MPRRVRLKPLRDGENVTASEFLRRWEEATPALKRVELIEGAVYLPSPVTRKHAEIHALLGGWAGTYTFQTPHCRAGLIGTWIMGDRDAPEPDLTLEILPEYGGQSRVEDDFSVGAPELIAELAVSPEARDLGVKFHLYENDAFWRHDAARVVAVLQQGLASPEHTAFVASLARQ